MNVMVVAFTVIVVGWKFKTVASMVKVVGVIVILSTYTERVEVVVELRTLYGTPISTIADRLGFVRMDLIHEYVGQV